MSTAELVIVFIGSLFFC